MQATVRLYGSLADFVASSRRGRTFGWEVGGRRSVKDLVESVGVPHCEVFLILVDGEAVGFDRAVEGGEQIAVYPHFSELDVTGLVTANPPLPPEPCFVLDGHLGRLAAYLRALGVDTAHERDCEDATIARIAAGQDRVVLTRDVGLLKRSSVRHGYWLRSTAPREQVAEVVHRFRLIGLGAAFTRCLRCNEPLVPLSRESARVRVPSRIHARFEKFSSCPACRRVYWPGTHYDRLSRVLDSYLNSAPRGIQR